MVLSCSICLLSLGQEVTGSICGKGDRNIRKFTLKYHIVVTTGKHYFRELFCFVFLLLRVEFLNKLNLRQTSVKDYPDTLYFMRGQRNGLSVFQRTTPALFHCGSASINPSISCFWQKQFRKWS